MKIAISNIAWNNQEDPTILPLFKKYSIKGIEIAPTKVWKNPTGESLETIKKYKKYWEDQGITISSTQAILFARPNLNIFADKNQRLELLSYIKKMTRVSALLGAEIMVFGSPKNRNIETLNIEEALGIATEFFYNVGEIAKLHSIYFCIEPNPKEYGTNFINNTKEAIQLIKRVNHPFFRLHLDSGVLTVNKENYKNSIIEGFPYLKHFHVSEKNLLPIGSTNINHKEISKILKNLKYDKWVSIEMRRKENQLNDKAVENAFKLVTSVY